MKILLLHSDFIEWEPKKKAVKSAEEIEKKVSSVDEVLVVFSAVEKSDEGKEKTIICKTSDEIEKVAREVKASNIVVYPYVHLSTTPSSPDTALKVLKGVEKDLKVKKFNVYRAPFGYYKRFKISVKGHPLSELSREIVPEGGKVDAKKCEKEVSEALKKEDKLKSEWFILTPDGKKHPIRISNGRLFGFDFSKHRKFEKLARYEMAKSRKMDQEPPHVALMKRLELVDYEPGSDPGNFRYLPKGKLIKSMLEQFTTQMMLDYGALEVETPVMYDYEHPSLKSYINRFPARQYTIETPNKKVFLRFAACFGSFLIAHDANISYRNLPLRMYEMTRYSFRVEQRGELAGLRRLRAFTMPDCHALCANPEQAKKEMLRRFDISKEIQNRIGLRVPHDFEFSIRMVKDFYEKNKDFVHKVVKRMGKPVLVEIWKEKIFYFIFKMEWNFVDALDKASCLTTDQIDVENSERYGIKFTDKDNKKKYPLILHLSPTGSIERVMYALLEKAYMEKQSGKNPILPIWLSPTQVRLCPVNDSLIKYCDKIADKIEKEQIRVDIDDRVESVSKKVRDSEREWIPYTIIVGDREKKSGKLAVRFRETSKVKQMSTMNLIREIKKQVKDMPYRPIPLPRMISSRPIFIG